MDFNPQAYRLSASCRNAGKCDYGIYPLPSRFYMTRSPSTFFSLEKYLSIQKAQVSAG